MFTKVHINALIAIATLAVIVVVTLLVESANQVVGCALGEVVLVCVGGIVWCAKAFAGNDAD